LANRGTIRPRKNELVLVNGGLDMKGLIVIIAGVILVFGNVTSRAANLDRMSTATGVPTATLQSERASTGLGWGSLEKAHLLANATGQSFHDIVAQHQAGEGWGKIAHDNGLNLGRLVSDAHRSSHATAHAQNTVHGKSTVNHGKKGAHGKIATNTGRGHTRRMSSAHGFGHGSSARSGFSGSHRMAMSHFGSHSMGSMGHGGVITVDKQTPG
jgi:hypothetical protein